MNLADSIKNPSLLAITGSRLYGVATKNSDVDSRGFCVPPLPYLFGLVNFEQSEDKETDTVIYSLKKFFNLLIQGNTQAIEVLFAKEYVNLDNVGQKVLNNRNIFLSKRYYKSMRGFASAEYRKAKCLQLHIPEPHADIIQTLCSTYKLKRFQRDTIVSLIEEYTDTKISTLHAHKHQVGQRRKEDIDKYGYSVKNAYHTIRILNQGIELLTSSTITYPRPEADLLNKIRQGKLSIEDFDLEYMRLESEIIEAEKNSTLPKVADVDSVNSLYMEIVHNFWKKL